MIVMNDLGPDYWQKSCLNFRIYSETPIASLAHADIKEHHTSGL